MRFSISGDHIKITAELREHVSRGLYFALGRFSPAISDVTVRVADINGPRGGVDKRCQIVVRLQLPGSSPVIIEETDELLSAAISHACERAGRTVARAVERGRCKKSYRRQRASAEEAAYAVEVDERENLV